MWLCRLIYVSENQLDPARGSLLKQLNDIMRTSRRNNVAAGITGSLVFDDMWFLQILEGESRAIRTAFDRIREDDRHGGVFLVEMVEIQDRLFGDWSMKLVKRSAAFEALFRPFVRNGLFRPDEMTASEIIALMRAVSLPRSAAITEAA